VSDTYLPADVRSRIVDLMKARKVTQKKLALVIGVSESSLSRFLSGKTEKLSEESVIRIARAFNVSTDFILGTTEIPDKKNYDIAELGLSVQAARNLYTGKVNSDVVNRLLESPRFATVTYMIAQYFDDTLAEGFAAQNQMIASVSSMLLGQTKTTAAVQAAREANAQKVPVYQADLANIEATFMAAVKEAKKEVGSDLAAAKALSQEVTEALFANLTKGQDLQKPTITPEQLADAITGTVSGAEGVNPEALDNFNQALRGLIQTMVPPNAQHDV
jgi:transcriptional regulator with XRE-family HTH domain